MHLHFTMTLDTIMQGEQSRPELALCLIGREPSRCNAKGRSITLRGFETRTAVTT